MEKIFQLWMETNIGEAQELVRASDMLELQPMPHAEGLPPQRFIAHFKCQTFVFQPSGEVTKSEGVAVGIWFPDRYLHEANTYEVLTWLAPTTVFHPNIRMPACCVGEKFFKPGTPLVELLYQLHAVISWQKWAAHAPLNESAAQWARTHQQLLPADPRPLKRRALKLNVSIDSATVTS